MSVITAATICAAFQATAERHAQEVALRTLNGATELTWAQYRERVERGAGALAALGVRTGDTVGLLLGNRPEFHVLDTAALHLGAAPFSLYATLAPGQIRDVLANARPRVLITEPGLAGRLTGIPHVLLEQLEATPPPPGFDLEAAWSAVRPDGIATLIYTSGTTGPPKGAMLTHANLLAAYRAAAAAAPVFTRRGRLLSYLPTAHLADRLFSHYPAMMNGSSITCADDPRTAVAGLASVRPTIWLAVPRIWEKLRAAVEAGLPLEALGLGEAELLVSGAAPIAPEVLAFFARRGVHVSEGYGMTESSGVATLNVAGEPGTVGPPLPGVEVRLAADGEVLIRGEVVMAGYRDEPERTAEAIDAEGWLRTGDIGELSGEHLRIVDRKKELIINAAGKNMSPANIERALTGASPLIAHAVAIGDRRPYNTALIVLEPELAGENARERVTEAIAAANATLSRVEQIKRFAIIEDTWLPDGRLLTPTLKLRRGPIAAAYAEEIEAMYA